MLEALALVPVLSFASSTIIGGLNLYLSHFQRFNSFETLRNSLGKIKATSPKESTRSEREELVKWLTYGDLILGPLKHKLTWRFFSTIAAIAVGSIAMAVDLPGGDISKAFPAFEWIDIVIAMIQVGVAFVNRTDVFLRPEEKEFLGYVASLHHRFYELYVVPAMDEFNFEMRYSKALKASFKGDERERDHIRSLVEEILEEKRGSGGDALEEGGGDGKKSNTDGPGEDGTPGEKVSTSMHSLRKSP